MEIQEIKQGSIIIAPSYLHPFLQQKWLAHHQGMFQIYIKTLSTFLSETMPKQLSKEVILWRYYHKITSLTNQLTTLKQVAPTYPFIKELYTFLCKQEQYEFSLETLPQTTQVQKELKFLLQELTSEKMICDPASFGLKKMIENNMDLSHVYIIDSYHSHIEQKQINTLCEHGATLLPWYQEQPTIHFYHSINKRQEVASIADVILQNHYRAEDIQITLCDDSYKPFLQQIFHQHQIPYTILFDQTASVIMKAFVLLLEYVMEPDTTHLLPLLDSSIFQVPYLHDLSTYLLLFEKELTDSFHHLESITISHDILSSYELEELQEIEQHANQAKEALLPQLALLQETNLTTLLSNCFDLLANKKQFEKNLSQLEQLLQESIEYLNTKEDLAFLISLCEASSESIRSDSYQGVMITDLQKPLLKTSIHFILGCDQKHYPAFSGEQGFFDETYMSEIAYPPLQNRYQHALTQVQKHVTNATTLYLFYAQGDFRGKSSEAALEMELLANQNSTLYPLKQYDAIRKENIQLTKETARSLFAPNQVIKGSISAFERYVNCPFSYFVRYGLEVKEPMDVSFNVAKIGTLSHYVMEQLTTTYQKAYTEHQEAIKPYLEAKIQEMMLVYPNKKALLANILARLQDNLHVLLELLKEMEDHSSYQPSHFEYRFEEEIKTNQEVSIQLIGVIDRIDFYEHFLRIIDYKSSTKVLSLQNILCGKQLQLLTYAYIAKHTFQKDVAGAYYQSLKNETTAFPYGKVKRRPVDFIPFDQSIAYADKQKKSGLKGWTMTEFIEALDHSGTHINGFSLNKEGTVQARTIYNMDAISEVLLQLYDEIIKQLLSGKIAPTPTKEACLFCTYHDICRFQGNFKELDPLVEELPENFYIKGGKQYEVE